ncbi:MAG TPA: class IV adenylate cyclase [Methylomirabilota bacterium]|jgi:predicted adenylyl cyclase CyaB|nr:class IV adenylate cyclase [Methylomirabilota bacterium]
MTHLTIEIKARCADPQRIRDILHAHNAEFRGVDRQIDTYFNTVQGRLKLREGRIENTLIYYEREDLAGPKPSHVFLFPLPSSSPLKTMLTAALGVLVVVEKQREIYFIDNVKFHIDNVSGLGVFVEIEAIDESGTIGEEKLLRQCNQWLRLFQIAPHELIAVSYSDLLLSQAKASVST